MIKDAIQNMSYSGKFTLDLTALGLALSAFFEKLAPVAATFASIAAFAWVCIQAYYFIKEKLHQRKKKQ